MCRPQHAGYTGSTTVASFIRYRDGNQLDCLRAMIAKIRSGEAKEDLQLLREFYDKYSRVATGIAKYAKKWPGNMICGPRTSTCACWGGIYGNKLR